MQRACVLYGKRNLCLQGEGGTGSNSGRMLLLAFDTLLKMKKDPAQYVLKMQSETGTDYEGKFK